ncbi:transporter [Hydrogenophaga crassostreae]|uniref:Transporter n=1 Tax=Hydrogenophaga crassostreae TaxID=1763535 RepID=A0A167H9Q1_9BURK|nr:BON domain-containing protein [Hydrogenophaga crassostreae]AOW12684.1 transporter [Hydrogenophaga crassostreae]OAD40556.1 transporter [Hydrogenophaga crassostreae]
MFKNIAIASALAISALTITGCAVSRDQQSVGAYIDDATATTQVKARFADHPVVSAMAIKVETLNGVVQLSGFAKSPDERQIAETIARGASGVKDVINGIVVRP